MEKICRLLGVRPEDMKVIFYRSPTPRYSSLVIFYMARTPRYSSLFISRGSTRPGGRFLIFYEYKAPNTS
jgi:hypothetical protein